MNSTELSYNVKIYIQFCMTFRYLPGLVGKNFVLTVNLKLISNCFLLKETLTMSFSKVET